MTTDTNTALLRDVLALTRPLAAHLARSVCVERNDRDERDEPVHIRGVELTRPCDARFTGEHHGYVSRFVAILRVDGAIIAGTLAGTWWSARGGGSEFSGDLAEISVEELAQHIDGENVAADIIRLTERYPHSLAMTELRRAITARIA